MPDRMYAIAVQDEELYLFLRIRRSPMGDVYVLFPRDGDWDPHVSYHASGKYHNKSYGHLFLGKCLQQPNESFVGTENLITTGLAIDEARRIGVVCVEEQFSEVLEIPNAELRPENYRTHLSVDLAEPDGQPIVQGRYYARKPFGTRSLGY